MDNLNSLFTYIQKVAGKLFSERQFKNTTTGTIIGSEAGYYEVQLISGNASGPVIAKPATDEKYSVGDYVYLLSTDSGSGDVYQTDFFIFGKVVNVNSDQVLEKTTEFLEEHNAKTSWNKLDGIKALNSQSIRALRLNGSFKLTARFTYPKNASDFGIKIYITYDNNETETLYFNTAWFSGQPYLFKETEQSKTFSLKRQDVKLVALTPFKVVYGEEEFDKKSVSAVSLTVGKLQNVNADFSVELKNTSNKSFFEENDNNELIEIAAKVQYKNQILETKNLKYYWFVQDSGIKSNSLGFNKIMGEGWRCLNETYEAETSNGSSINIYKNTDNFINISKNNVLNYKNIIVCVATYKEISFKSNEIIIYDLRKAAVTVTAKVTGANPLIYTEDVATLSAEIKFEDTPPDSFKNVAVWYARPKSESEGDFQELELPEGENNIEVVVAPVGQESGLTEGTNRYVISRDSAGTEFYCTFDGLEDKSDNILIYPFQDSEINATIYEERNVYKYWVSYLQGMSFEEWHSGESTQDDLSDDYYYYEPKNNQDFFINKENISEEDFQSIYKNSFFEGLDINFGDANEKNIYIYYSVQKQIWNKNKNSCIRLDDYSIPKITRWCVLNRDEEVDIIERTHTEIEQLNIFNELSRNGDEAGLQLNQDGRIQIGGFYVDGSTFQDNYNNVLVSPGYRPKDYEGDHPFAFWAGEQTISGDDESRPFWVKNDGTFSAKQGIISSTINIGQGNVTDSTSSLSASVSIEANNASQCGLMAQASGREDGQYYDNYVDIHPFYIKLYRSRADFKTNEAPPWRGGEILLTKDGLEIKSAYFRGTNNDNNHISNLKLLGNKIIFAVNDLNKKDSLNIQVGDNGTRKTLVEWLSQFFVTKS